MQAYGYIYKVTNAVTGKSYIGQTTQKVQKRWTCHCSDAKNRPSTYLGKSIKKYGREVFQIALLDTGFDKFDLGQLEIHYIKTLNTQLPHGYNMTDGGGGSKNPSAETRKKMSAAKKGKRSSPSTEFKKGFTPSNKGKKHTQEAKDKMSKSLVGRVPWNKGVRGQVAWNKAQIIDSNGTIYSSLTDAAQKLSLKSHVSISNVLSGKSKTAAGLSFSYLDKQAG